MAKLPSGQIPLDIWELPKDVAKIEGSDKKPSYGYFTDESGKKYYFKGNTEAEMQSIADALKKQGYATDTSAQYQLSPLEAAQARYGWQESAHGSPEEYQAFIQARAKEMGNQALDLPNWGEDITGRLVPNVKGQMNIDRSVSQPVQATQPVQQGQAPVQPTTPQQPTPATGTQQAQQGYTGPSIVDYLKSIGQPSDYATRAKIALQKGIANYTGTADQNTQLLNTLRGGTQVSGTQGGTGVTTSGQADIPAQIQNVQAQIANLTQQLGLATEAGYGPGGEHAGEQIPGTPSPTTIANTVLTDNGVTVDPNKAVTNPTGSWQDIYTDLFSKLGLDKVKDEIAGVIAKIQAIDDQMAEEVADTNENPWISEGARVRKIQQIQNKYDMKKAGLNSALTLMQGIYDDGRQETQFLVSTALSQYNADRTFDLNEQKMLADQAEDKLTAKKDTQVVEVGGRKILVDTQTGEKIADLGETKGGITEDGSTTDVETYAKDVASGRITLSGVPKEIRTQVSRVIDTLRNWTDSDINTYIQEQAKTGAKKADLMVMIRGDKGLTTKDKERFMKFINIWL